MLGALSPSLLELNLRNILEIKERAQKKESITEIGNCGDARDA